MLYFHAPGRPEVKFTPGDVAPPPGVNWIDALCPDPQEAAFLEQALGVAVPTLEELSEIESSSRLRSAKDWLYLSMPMIYRRDGFTPAMTPLGFAVSKDVLLTVRFKRMKPFERVAEENLRIPMDYGGYGALAAVMDGIADHVADVLESVSTDLDRLSDEIFGANGVNGRHRPREDNEKMRTVMRKIGRYGDHTGKIEDLLLGIGRIVPYVLAHGAPHIEPDIRAKLKILQRDISSLDDYETHLAGKIHFLLDATLGLTNIEQNNIFRILTVVSVVGIPPTFFASLWGMNFKEMPELEWSFGYELSLLVIALSAIVPAWWFKKQGWW
ncbi:MAG TPA: CorA family divalent cation transporter [Methylocella sp.]|nr:CorA family divalent cation transporter [Methylocella sp.]